MNLYLDEPLFSILSPHLPRMEKLTRKKCTMWFNLKCKLLPKRQNNFWEVPQSTFRTQNCALLLPQNEYLVFAKIFLSSLLSRIWPVSYIWRRPVKSEALRCLAQVLNCQCHLVNNVRLSIEKFHHRGDNSYSCHSSLHSLWLDSNSIVFSNSLYTQDRQISPLQLILSLTLISRHFD